MKVDTNDLWHDEWRSTIQPAEAATEIGVDDYDDSAPEGFAIAVGCVIGCIVAALLLAAAF